MSQELAKERALKQRNRMKSKRPTFRRQESWRYKRVSQVWRKPDGIDSKMRRRTKGWPASARIGYRGPRIARYLHPSGYEEVVVRNVDDLSKVDSETQAVRIAHTVGMKKRADISVRAEERHIHILNPLPKEKPAEEEEKAEEVEKAAEAETPGEKHETEEAETKTEAESELVDEGTGEVKSEEESKK
jgi:large subunit ribosomal protein L32e